MINWEKYECSKVLGEGAYSQVRLATDTTNNKQCALKIMKLNCEECKETINEARMMEDLKHDNIITLIEFCEEAKLKKDNIVKRVSYVAYELAEKGWMYDYLYETGSFSESVSRYFFTQVIDAVEYLHSKGISHRDIKSENIVLDSEFNVKLCDFGFATKNLKCTTFKGTEAYMAPEIYQKNGYIAQHSDVFALGVLLFAMVFGKLPFISANPNDCRYKLICSKKIDLFWRTSMRNRQGAELISEELKQLIQSMLSPEAIDRPSLSEIKQFDWFKGATISKKDLIKEFISREEIITKNNEEELI